MRSMLLGLPFVVPPLFHRLYAPINESWTVARFGCGCPPLDLSWRFNANHFNFILWSAVCVGCVIAWWWLVRPDQPHRATAQSPAMFGVGIGILAMMCLRYFGQEVWM